MPFHKGDDSDEDDIVYVSASNSVSPFKMRRSRGSVDFEQFGELEQEQEQEFVVVKTDTSNER